MVEITAKNLCYRKVWQGVLALVKTQVGMLVNEKGKGYVKLSVCTVLSAMCAFGGTCRCVSIQDVE